MTRAVRVLSVLFTALAVWAAVVFRFVDTKNVLSEKQMEIVQILPLWSLIAFASYSLASIGWALFEFRDCPQAFKELEVDIKNARASLQKRGFKFDE